MSSDQLPEGYKQTEVGVIPEDWEVKAVGEVCDFIVPGRNKPKIFKGSIPWITTPDLEDGRSVSESKAGLFVSREEAKSVGSKIVPPCSILMSCVGELGIVAFVEREIVINQQLHAFIPSEAVDPFFLLNALQAQKDYMLSIATITAVPYLNKDNCNSIPIPIPLLPEQRSIAQALSDVDRLIAALEKAIAKKRAIKTATMQQLLTGKKRLPGFGEGKGYQQTELGIIPEDWGIDTFGKLYAEPSRNGIYKTAEYQGQGIRIVNMGEMFGLDFISDQEMNRILLTPKEIAINRLLDGDLLFGRRSVVPAGAGKCSIIITPPELMTFESSIIRVRLNTVEASPLFHYYFFASPFGRTLMSGIVSGTNIKGIRGTELQALKIPQPPLSEQQAIAAVLSDMDTEIAALETRLAKTQSIKQGMMQELLTGRTRLV